MKGIAGVMAMKKRIALMFLCILIFQLFAPCAVLAEDTQNNVEDTFYQTILNELMDGNRHWVIETLVDDNRQNNPMAIVCGGSIGNVNTKSLAREQLDIYNGLSGENSDDGVYVWLYKKLVDGMEVIYNIDEYASSVVSWLFNEIGEALTSLFTDEESTRQRATSLFATKGELTYDKMLKGILTEEFKSSDGTSILNTDEAYNDLKIQLKSIKAVKDLTSVLKSYDSAYWGYDDAQQFDAEFIDGYATPMLDSAEKSVGSFLSIVTDGIGLEEYEKRSLKLVTTLAYDRLLFREMVHTTPVINKQRLIDEYPYLLNDTIPETTVKDIYADASKTIGFVYTSLDQYLYLNAIQYQKEELIGPVSRLIETSENEELRSSLFNFKDLAEQEYDARTLMWDVVQNYVRSESVAGKWVIKQGKNALKATALAGDKVICSAISVASIANWCADKIISLKELCQKTYELKYWEKMVDDLCEVYRQDLRSYSREPSEEWAEAVLDDLRLLQKVRMYGEKIANELRNAPTESLLGLALNGDQVEEQNNKEYQYSIDILMAASVVPANDPVEVKNGELLTFMYHDRAGLYARVTSSGKPTYYYVDIPFRMNCGVIVNGELRVYVEDDKAVNIGAVELGSSGTVYVARGNLQVAQFEQVGSTNQILINPGSAIDVFYDLKLNTVSSGQLEEKGEFVCRNLEISGNVPYSIEVWGNVQSARGSAATLLLSGTDTQTISGSMTVSEMRFIGNTVRFTAGSTIKVEQMMYCHTMQIYGGKNLIFSGNTIDTGYFNGSFVAQNASLSDVTVNGVVYDAGGNTYSGTDTFRSLQVSNSSELSGNPLLIVRGFAWFDTPLNGNGTIRVSGDFGAKDKLTISQPIILDGKAKQTVKGNFTVDSIIFTSSPDEIVIQDQLTVTSSLDSRVSKISNESPLILQDGAELSGNFPGIISVGSFNSSTPREFGGLIVRENGSVEIPEMKIEKRLLFQRNASVAADSIEIGETLVTPGTVTMNVNECVTKNAEISGTILELKTIRVKQNAFLDNFASDSTLLLEGDLTTSGTVSLGALKLIGPFRQMIRGNNISVGELSINNHGYVVQMENQTIRVTGTYKNESASPVRNGRIVCNLSNENNNAVLNGTAVMEEPLVLSNSELIITGDLNVPSIELTNSSLMVQGELVITDGQKTVNIDSNSQITVCGDLFVNNGSFIVDGMVIIRGDLLTEKTTITGGTWIIGGDLYGSRAIRITSLTMNGLVRQRIDASDFIVGDLIFRNPSKGGILLMKPITYTGIIDFGDTPVFGTDRIQEAA